MATIESQGITISVADKPAPASPPVVPTYAKLGEVRTITGPDGQATEIDVSNLDSVARQFRMGLPDEGNVTLGMAFDPGDAQQMKLFTLRQSRTSALFQIDLKNASPSMKIDFEAYVPRFTPNIGVDEVVLLDVTLRVTGPVAIA